MRCFSPWTFSIMSRSTLNGGKPTYKIASIPADGIGPEVISAGIQVLEKLSSVLGTFDFQFDHIEWSSDFYKKHGKYIPEGGLDDLKKYNAIFFGSVGAPGTSNSSRRSIPRRKAEADTPAQMFQIISLFGASASQSASPSSNTPMFVQRVFCAVSPPLSRIAGQGI